MSMLPASVAIHEVGPREGSQIEQPPIPTAQKIELSDALSETGLKSIELVAFVSPEMGAGDGRRRGRAARHPAQARRALHRHLPQRTRLATRARCRLRRGRALSLNASDAFSKRNTNKTTAEAVAELPAFIAAYRAAGIPVDRIMISAAFGCNFEGYVPLERLLDCIERLCTVAADAGETVKHVKLADTMGWANPEQIRRTIDAIRNRRPELEIALHLHDTRGLGLANADAALREGVREFDSAVAGLGGCPFAAVAGAPGNIAQSRQLADQLVLQRNGLSLCHDALCFAPAQIQIQTTQPEGVSARLRPVDPFQILAG